MKAIMQDFSGYLQDECRYPQEQMLRMLGGLAQLLERMKVHRVEDLDGERVMAAWRRQRWIETDLGIEVSEDDADGGLPVLKSFLGFLEETGLLPESGLSELIPLPETSPARLRALSKKELDLLRSFLVFHVDSDVHRRETALCFLLLATGFSLDELRLLNVHKEGYIKINAQNLRSGHFHYSEQQLWVRSPLSGDGLREIALPEETSHFLNFYLENRSARHAYAFLSTAKKSTFKRITIRGMEQSLERVLSSAGIPIRKNLASLVLRETAYARRKGDASPARHIVSRQPERQQEQRSDSAMMLHVA